jgi:hypothetical protein
MTIKLGKTSKSFVVTQEPYPKVGDLVTIKGQRQKWTVLKVVDCPGAFFVTFPVRAEKREGAAR